MVRSLALTGDQYRYIPVLAANEGFRVSELAGQPPSARRTGSSKYGLERYVRGFLDLLTILFIGRFRQRPMHLFGGVGMLLIVVGVDHLRLPRGAAAHRARASATGRSCCSACC